ncbi:hypothetical protein PENTCL1PPCAC_6943 [Pristionchus entomophagus]|uniref:Uncharacterized protein n=1 Tax=Pristionchus entomophagus TaxID=358040 RepID=A0AAV5SNS0_9BILA|nr:hypothetical protein PENTCL1PPCAC_6943 [Pristionchus entomophagus]
MSNPEIESELGEEEEEEEPIRASSSSIDWGSLFSKANGILNDDDMDDEEEAENPAERAVKVLREDKQSYWIKTVRDIAQLMETHIEDTINLVLPQLQETLKEQKEILDLHCEAAVLYKDLLRNEILLEKQPSLVMTLLDYIVENANRQKDNLSSAAWLETLTDITDTLPLDIVKSVVVPIFIQQANPSQKVQKRLMATKLLEKLVRIVSPYDIRHEFEKPIQQLSMDDYGTVRISMAQRLIVVAERLDKCSDVSRIVLPCLVSLSEDEDANVREASLPSLVSLIPRITRDTKRSIVIPFFRKLVERGMEKKDDRLALPAKYFGELLAYLFDDMDILDQTWALNSYIKLVSMARTDSVKLLPAKRACAYNLPCMYQLYPSASTRFASIIHDFCVDSDDEVRISIASSFDQLLQMCTEKKMMIGPFIELVRGGSIEVVAKIATRFSSILPILYRSVAEAPSSDNLSPISIDRLILGCNQLLQGSGNWRAHESLLHSISSLVSLVDHKTLFHTFVPLLKTQILTVRGVPCREAASRSLLLLMKNLYKEEERKEIIQFFNNDLAHHSNSYRRMIYLESVVQVHSIFSHRVLHSHFLHTALSLSSDPISNVRLKLCRILSILKSSFVLPENEETLQECEGIVRNLMENETNSHSKSQLSEMARDFSRADTGKRKDGENERREKEEDELWNEKRGEEIEEKRKKKEDQVKEKILQRRASREMIESSPESDPERSQTSIDKSRSLIESSCSPLRMERRSIAVVRPQPVVHVRWQSPAPSPSPSPSPTERKSRLPLSTATTSGKSRSPLTTSIPSPPSSAVRDRLRAQSETRTTSTSSSSALGKGSIASSANSFSISKSQSSSHLRRPSFALSKVSSSSNIERRPASMSMRIRNINIL